MTTEYDEVLWQDSSAGVRVIEKKSDAEGRGKIIVEDTVEGDLLNAYTYLTEKSREAFEEKAIQRASSVVTGIYSERLRTLEGEE